MSSSRFTLRRALVGCLIVFAIGLFWQVTSAQNPDAEKKDEPSIANVETLGGAERFLTHVSTDKPIYRPGEKLYMRGVVLHHATHKPLNKDANVNSQIKIVGPKGDTVAAGNVNAQDSVLGFEWQIPEQQAGGEYTIKVTFPWTGHPPAERKFDVRAYRAPRLKNQIKFMRDGYGPGDDVVATLKTERAEGGVPAGAKVTVIARVDGAEAYRGQTKIDEQGNCTARFQLPPEIVRGEGTLALVIEDGGVVETASKTIPILLQTVDLTMYSEGGELVAGLPNRVYFEAFTPAKKPADLAGVVLDQDGKEVAKFRSEHEGRGRFAFTPQAGDKYELKITEPSGINTRYPLPELKEAGVMLTADHNVVAKNTDVQVTVGATQAGEYTVSLRKRAQEVASEKIRLDSAQTKQVTLKAGDADGVLIATVWDADGRPRAERLVFRQPAHGINIKITADQDQYVPGGKAKLNIQTTSASGQPISAVVGVTVTDDTVLEMIEKREQAPRLPVMVLLEDDVRELADAHVYLDPENQQAPLAVDLLLGTQGWRRFALVDLAKFIGDHGDAGRRVLAMQVQKHYVTRGRRRNEAIEVFRAVDGAEGVLEEHAKLAEAVPQQAAQLGEKGRHEVIQQEGKKAGPKPAGEPAAPAAPPVAGKPAPSVANRKRIVREELSNEQQQVQRALQRADEKVADLRIAADAEAADEFIARNDFVTVRVYAHEIRANRQPGERIDFTETLCWHAGVRTDEAGKASVEFGLNDSVTSFRVFADAFAANGALGSESIQIESVEPFYIEPKLPLEVTSGDLVQVPIGIVNATDADLQNVSIQVNTQSTKSTDDDSYQLSLPAGARLRKLMKVRVGKFHGDVEFTLTGTAGPYGDKVTRSMAVKPLGFPIEVGHGGLISPNGLASHEITIPDNLVPGSLQARVVVYPTPLASMTEALERLIREPSGCFEQTSSTTYPLVMAQQYFMSHQGVDPALVERSADILEKGYNRLIGFECKSGGYEWFGNDPGHDALTAYGLLEFTDMAQVRHVDPAMLERTQKWLLSQRDGKGGFARKTHTLHTWLPDPEISNSYNTWALLEAGIDADLSAEVQWIRRTAQATQNTYVMALAANVLSLGGDKEGENHLLDRLAGKQTEDGSLTGATKSVVGSGGQALAIETTSLAVLAWLRNPSYAPNVEKSIQYLAESCKAGRFGSTQSTVLALRAIVAYDQSRAKPKAPGNLQLVIDGNPVGQPVEFTKDTQGAIELPDLATLLAPGEHDVQIKMADGSQMPYSVAVNYHSLKPDTSKDCKVHLEAKLNDTEIDEGAATEAQVTIVNRSNEPIPTPIAIIGIPGGLEVRHDQLKELVKEGKIAAYEVLGRDVVLYWRTLDAEQRVDLPLSLIAAIPGTYTGPASRAYLYYTDEHKHWVDGMQVTITPKSS